MAVVTFSCPECGKILKSSKGLPAGKKIKCPTCATIFPLPAADDEEPSAAVSTKPRSPSRAVSARDEDDEDEEDRPRGKKKSVAKGRSRGRGLLIGGAAGAVLLVLIGAGVGAYFLLFSGVNRGGGNEEPLAFVPAGTEVLVGLDGAAIQGDPTLGSRFEMSLRELTNAGDFLTSFPKETGLDVKELFAHALICTDLDSLNQLALRGGMAGGPQGPGIPMPPRGGPGAAPRPRGTTLVLRPSRPFDQKKVVAACKKPVHKKAHGQHYYEINEGELRTLFMPSDRTLILSTLSAGELDALFGSDGTTPSVSADTADLMHGAGAATLSVVVPFEGQVRAKLDEGVRQGNKADPMQPMMEQIAKGKGAALWATLEGQQLKLGLNVRCADPAAATATTQMAEKSWNGQKLQLIAGSLALKTVLKMPKTGKLLDELLASVKFSAEGTTARVTAALERTTLADVVTEAQNKQMAGGGPFGGFNPNPGGGLPRPGGKK